MEPRRHRLRVLPSRLAVCRLAAGEELPAWLDGPSGGAAVGEILSITRTPGETSVVCREERMPPHVAGARGWRALEVAGPLELGETGVLAVLSRALAAAGVSLFALSTYDTDYLLVRAGDLDRAVEALTAEGHEVVA